MSTKYARGLFTVAAVDNLDHNPSSTTSKDSFHGTSISLMQLPTLECPGQDRGRIIINHASSTREIGPLPEEYTSVLPASLKRKEFTSPAVESSVKLTDSDTFTKAQKEEWKWLDVAMEILKKQSLQNTYWISWSACASIQEVTISPAAINALLPLFLESVHSVAMIKHSMTVVQAATQHLNPGQVPIITADQPLYAIAKQIQ